ncbi:TonB-dependent siderophore receptor [Chitinophaga sp. LS1]|uniref:TonB-dependent siderophore receptor n=1 Tax=Chitinophaga sp. LS1 TaxID=3051176 RepID=UPI002AAB22F2|nr:TonB-dependent siderophore receptor [Chitinophaga sp. LS1]WPV65196.1 TonB-dependent siderophore receptor [Chitinophaga sp. LS1]
MNQNVTRYTFTTTLLFTLLLSSLWNIAKADEFLSAIRGKVITSDGQPAPYVTVQVKGTGRGIVTDQNGEFIFKKIKPGTYTLQVSLIGYESVEQTVTVEEDKVAHATIQLSATNQQMKEVVIVGDGNKYKVDAPSTSLRIATPIKDVPQSIEVLTHEVLQDQQIFDMQEDVSRNISGAMRIGHWDIYTKIQARGSQLSAFRNGMNVVSSPWSPLTEDMSMVDRIEIVKGPAGFMLSSGEPSGFYNVVTKKPTGLSNNNEIALTVGSFNTYRGTLDLDGKLSKNGRLLYRLNVMGTQRDSWRNYEFNNRYSIAPVLKYLIDDRTSVTLEYNRQFVQEQVIGSNYAFSRKGYADLPINFTTADPKLDPTKITDQSLTGTFEHNFNNNWKFTAQLAYLQYDQRGQSMWPSYFSSFNDSLLQRNIGIWDALAINRTGQFFVNGKFKTGPVTHTVLGGLDMKRSQYWADWNQSQSLGDTTFNIYKPTYSNVTQPTWDRSQNIRVRGVEYDYGYTTEYLQDELGFLNNTLRLTIAGRYTTNIYNNPYSTTKNESKFTPRVGVSYSVISSLSAYFVYDEVFMQNGGTDWEGKTFKPLTGSNLELGVKKEWFGGRLSTNVAIYQIVKNNVLATDLEHESPTAGFIYSRTNGQQKIKGVEVDVKGELARGLSVVANYAYTDGQVTKDSYASLVGNYISGTAKHIQNSWVTYRVPAGVLNGLRIFAGYQWQIGRIAGQVYDKSENFLPDYFRLDGGVGYNINKFSFNVNVNNVLNKYLYTGAPSYDNNGNHIYYWQAEAGRNLRVSTSYRF